MITPYEKPELKQKSKGIRMIKKLSFILLCLIITACRFGPIEIKNISFSLSKNTYKPGEEIELSMKCQFDSKAYVNYVYIGVDVNNLDELDEVDNTPKTVAFDVLKKNGSDIDVNDRYYKEFKELHNSCVYRYSIQSEEIIMALNEKLSIAISERGFYEITVCFTAGSTENYAREDIEFVKKRFRIE